MTGRLSPSDIIDLLVAGIRGNLNSARELELDLRKDYDVSDTEHKMELGFQETFNMQGKSLCDAYLKLEDKLGVSSFRNGIDVLSETAKFMNGSIYAGFQNERVIYLRELCGTRRGLSA